MEKYSLNVQPNARKHLQIHHRSGDRNTIKRIEQIFEELSEHPETGIGSPERLKHQLTDYWSREINRKDRLIYHIHEATVTVTVISAKGHYSDK